MANCTGITIGADYNCTDPVQPGVSTRLLMFNLADIDTITYDATNTYIVSSITLKSGKAAFAFQGVKQSLQPQYALVPQAFSVGYDHQIDFSVFDISAAQKTNLEAMAVVKQVAIVENVNDAGNGENFFEIYGLSRGLEMIENTRIASDLESAGAFRIQLKTSDNEGKENKMPSTWFDTDYATTKALVDALLTPVP